jgi:hypothetical protein
LAAPACPTTAEPAWDDEIGDVTVSSQPMISTDPRIIDAPH